MKATEGRGATTPQKTAELTRAGNISQCLKAKDHHKSAEMTCGRTRAVNTTNMLFGVPERVPSSVSSGKEHRNFHNLANMLANETELATQGLRLSN